MQETTKDDWTKCVLARQLSRIRFEGRTSDWSRLYNYRKSELALVFDDGAFDVAAGAPPPAAEAAPAIVAGRGRGRGGGHAAAMIGRGRGRHAAGRGGRAQGGGKGPG